MKLFDCASEIRYDHRLPVLNPLQISLSVARHYRMSRPHSELKKTPIAQSTDSKSRGFELYTLAVGLLVIGIIGYWIEDSLTENNLK